MVAATLSLLGFLLSLYLWLWKIGVVGTLACGTGSCETVQLSSYGEILGIPVAFFGVAGYLGLLVVSLAGLQPRWLNSPGPTKLLALLSGLGVAFTAYLTYLEAAVIHAWCRWCLVSAGLIAAVFAVSLLSLRTSPSAPAPHPRPPA